MADSVLTLTAYNAPYGIDETNTRMWLRGTLSFGAGNYETGGLAPVYAPIKDASGQAVLLPTLNAAPDEITFYSLTGSGYIYQRVASNGKIKVLESAGSATPLAELTGG